MKRETLELTIERMAFGGEALASYRGKKIFIPWGVAGDRVKIELTEEKKDYARGRIIEILEKSAHRVAPPCPYFFKCGGCQWQHLGYESQVHFKTEILKEALERIAKIRDPYLLKAIAAASPLHYRQRIRLQVSRQGEVGFVKPQSKEVVTIDRCLIAREPLNEKIPEAKTLAMNLLEKDRAKRHEIELRLSSPSPLMGEGRGEGEKVIIEADPPGESPFTQVHEEQNRMLIQRAMDSLELKGNEKVLELFAGEGNFTFPISERAGSVTAVETDEASVLRAEKTIEERHRKNIQFIQSTSYRFLQNLPSSPFDALLLDPPRKGAQECLEGILKQ